MVGAQRHDQPHVDAAPRGQAQGPRQHLVGHVIGRDDPDPALCREDQRQQRFVERVAGDVRAAGHDLNDARVKTGCSTDSRARSRR